MLRFLLLKTLKLWVRTLQINLCLILNQFFIVYTIPCATFNDLTYTTTICFNCYYSLHIFPLHNNYCSIALYNWDLQTTIILFTRNVSSHKNDWILSELPLLALSCLLYHRVSSFNEYSWSRMSLLLRNLYKCKQVAYSVVVACVFVYSLIFILMLLLFVYFFITFFYTDFVG